MRNRVRFAFSTAAVAAVAVTTLTGLPDAQAARRFSLAGNKLIADKDDVYAYPQLATDHARMIGFDYGAASNSGNALLLLGDKHQAWGIAVHRGDAMTPWKLETDGDLGYLGNYGSGLGLGVQAEDVGDGAGAGAGGAGLAATPMTIFDVLYGSGDPGNSAWGLRLTLGSDKKFDDPKASGAKENFTAEHFLGATFGYTDHTGNLEYDAAASVLIDMGSQTANGKEVNKASRYDLTLQGRGSMPLPGEKDTRLGVLGELRYGTSKIEPKGAGSNSADDLHLVGGAGPVVKITDRITVSGYGTLGISRRTHDPDSKNKGDLEGRLAILFPGINLATEIRLKDWMFFRTGTNYTYSFNLQDVGKSPTGNEHSDRSAAFVWNAGLGFQFADLTVDGALSHQFITAGPDFIGGDPAALFAMVSASAKF